MTTELEQQFFKVFGIEPKIYETDGRDIDDNGDVCSWYIEEIYPEITDRVLLELICILGNGGDGDKNLNLYTANEDEWFAVLKDKNNLAYCAAIDKSFKNAILKLCIYRADIEDFKQQIQSLLREEE